MSIVGALMNPTLIGWTMVTTQPLSILSITDGANMTIIDTPTIEIYGSVMIQNGSSLTISDNEMGVILTSSLHVDSDSSLHVENLNLTLRNIDDIPQLILSMTSSNSSSSGSYTFGDIQVSHISWGDGYLVLNLPIDLPYGNYTVLTSYVIPPLHTNHSFIHSFH
jgi:hypothetical protein